MNHRAHLLAASSLTVALVLAACVPHRDLQPDQIDKLDKLAEVMDVQATVADPQFKKIGQSAYTDEDWKAFADMSNRLQATSKKIHQFTKGPEMDKLADQLNAHATKLGDVAAKKDAAAASETLAAMKATCKECHSKFK